MCSFADHLRGFRNVFTFPQDNSYGNQFGCYVTLHTMLKTPEEKTRAVGEVIKCLSEKELIPGIRNEVLIDNKNEALILILAFDFDCSFQNVRAPY